MKYTDHIHRNNILIAVIVLAWIFRDQITNQIIGFLLTGALPGLSISVPYWIMFLTYLFAIIGIVTIYFNHTASTIRHQDRSKTRRTMPRRRYSNI